MHWKVQNTKEQIDKLKGFAGVYCYLDKGKPLYIGKSTHVKARLLSHLESAKLNKKEALYVFAADTLEFYQTDSEFNALLLESKLIQTHKPRYNVRWMDDKSYLYIKITHKEVFPKVYPVRKEYDPRALYFGPFTSQDVVESIIRILRKIFPFCTQKTISKRPCFHSKIGLCCPCPNSITSERDRKIYRKNIKNVISVLRGNSTKLQKHLMYEIKRAADEENFERALEYRRILFKIEHIYSNRLFQPEDPTYNRSSLLIAELKKVLSLYYHGIQNLTRIECYDISNLSQTNPTASMVVFTDGQMTKSEYRKFKIGKTNAKGDVNMLVEALSRRLKNKWDLPDLIVIDGGKPQLRAILKFQVSNEALRKIPIIGIAKNPDRLIMGIAHLPTVRLRLNNPALNLVQHLRDESHRFAKKYHTVLRTRLLTRALS